MGVPTTTTSTTTTTTTATTTTTTITTTTTTTIPPCIDDMSCGIDGQPGICDVNNFPYTECSYCDEGSVFQVAAQMTSVLVDTTVLTTCVVAIVERCPFVP